MSFAYSLFAKSLSLGTNQGSVLRSNLILHLSEHRKTKTVRNLLKDSAILHFEKKSFMYFIKTWIIGFLDGFNKTVIPLVSVGNGVTTAYLL